jgi:hypothetical protein
MDTQLGAASSVIGWSSPFLISIGGILGAAASWFTGWHMMRHDNQKTAIEEQDRVAIKHRQERLDDAAIIDALTRRFQTLIEGYEKRIADLTAEVKLLRTEVINLHARLDSVYSGYKHESAS